MSEPSKGSVPSLSIHSVPGGFIVSWQIEDTSNQHRYFQAAQFGQMGALPVTTTERVCAGLPALLTLLQATILVQP